MNPELVKAQIARLLIEYPELAEDEEGLLMSLDSETDAVTMLNQVLARIQQTKATEGGVASWVADLRARLDMLDRRNFALRKLAMQIMETAGITKIPLTLGTIRIQQGPAKVIITDETMIPNVLKRFPPPEPDKAKIKEMLRSGQAVQGAVLSNGEPFLAIKTK